MRSNLLSIVSLILAGVVPARAHAPDFQKMAADAGKKDDIPSFTLRYRDALQKLDLATFKALHHPKVLIFESGHKNVGWEDYEKNHLKPELDAFTSFKFTRWEESSQIFGDSALVVAEIGYAIDTKDAMHHEATGVATLLLRRAQDGWQVIHSHWSTAK